MRKPVIILDIDGTVSNCDHRQEHAQAGNWEGFHALCHLDAPYLDVVAIIQALSQFGYAVFGLTGRNEKNRRTTLDWLIANNIIIDELLMRPDNDFTKDIDLKIRLLEERFGSKEQVLAQVQCVFDDRDRVVAGLRDYGLTVFQPREGAY